MKVGRVAGTVVSTIKIPVLEEHRLLLCDIEDWAGKPSSYTIAVDVVDAGVGDDVLILDEGSSARQILGLESGAIRAVVVGIVDQLTVDGETLSSRDRVKDRDDRERGDKSDRDDEGDDRGDDD